MMYELLAAEGFVGLKRPVVVLDSPGTQIEPACESWMRHPAINKAETEPRDRGQQEGAPSADRVQGMLASRSPVAEISERLDWRLANAVE
jgi:hypothetical protein